MAVTPIIRSGVSLRWLLILLVGVGLLVLPSSSLSRQQQYSLRKGSRRPPIQERALKNNGKKNTKKGSTSSPTIAPTTIDLELDDVQPPTSSPILSFVLEEDITTTNITVTAPPLPPTDARVTVAPSEDTSITANITVTNITVTSPPLNSTLEPTSTVSPTEAATTNSTQSPVVIVVSTPPPVSSYLVDPSNEQRLICPWLEEQPNATETSSDGFTNLPLEFPYQLYVESTIAVEDVLPEVESRVMQALADRVLLCNVDELLERRSLQEGNGVVALDQGPEDEILSSICGADCTPILGQMIMTVDSSSFGLIDAACSVLEVLRDDVSLWTQVAMEIPGVEGLRFEPPAATSRTSLTSCEGRVSPDDPPEVVVVVEGVGKIQDEAEAAASASSTSSSARITGNGNSTRSSSSLVASVVSSVLIAGACVVILTGLLVTRRRNRASGKAEDLADHDHLLLASSTSREMIPTTRALGTKSDRHIVSGPTVRPFTMMTGDYGRLESDEEENIHDRSSEVESQDTYDDSRMKDLYSLPKTLDFIYDDMLDTTKEDDDDDIEGPPTTTIPQFDPTIDTSVAPDDHTTRASNRSGVDLCVPQLQSSPSSQDVSPSKTTKKGESVRNNSPTKSSVALYLAKAETEAQSASQQQVFISTRTTQKTLPRQPPSPIGMTVAPSNASSPLAPRRSPMKASPPRRSGSSNSASPQRKGHHSRRKASSASPKRRTRSSPARAGRRGGSPPLSEEDDDDESPSRRMALLDRLSQELSAAPMTPIKEEDASSCSTASSPSYTVPYPLAAGPSLLGKSTDDEANTSTESYDAVFMDSKDTTSEEEEDNKPLVVEHVEQPDFEGLKLANTNKKSNSFSDSENSI